MVNQESSRNSHRKTHDHLHRRTKATKLEDKSTNLLRELQWLQIFPPQHGAHQRLHNQLHEQMEAWSNRLRIFTPEWRGRNFRNSVSTNSDSKHYSHLTPLINPILIQTHASTRYKILCLQRNQEKKSSCEQQKKCSSSESVNEM